MIHQWGPVCTGCNTKLKDADPFLRVWFYRVKKFKPDAHIAWAFRNHVEQEQAYLDGESGYHWPNSPHNVMDNGEPKARALDLFAEDEHGKGSWNPRWFRDIAEFSGSAVLWGGNFKSNKAKKLGDYDHFEMFEEDPGPAA